MPDGDGIELLDFLRNSNDTRLKFMKFIMITGANDKILKAMDNGAHNIIHKPFTPETILKKVELIFN
ncbi:MAG: response regulator [Bacteriovoracaceae bacterium]|nr:response regulator [Bacteriovoracaceae bacterium]